MNTPADSNWEALAPLRGIARAACGLPAPDRSQALPPAQVFLSLLERHRLLPLAAAHLPPGDLPEAVKRRAMALSANTSRRIEVLGGIARALDRAGVRWLLFKGPALAAEAYGDPAARPLDDLDVIVHPGDAEPAIRLLEELGWRDGSQSAGERALRLHGNWGLDFRHPTREGLIELKVDILPSFCGMNLRRLVRWNNLRRVRVDEFAIPVLDTDLHLLALTGHGAWHRWERMLWICDVSALLHSGGLPDGCIELARQHGWRTILALGLHLVRETLQPEAPAPAALPPPAAGLISDCMKALSAANPSTVPPLRGLRFQLGLRERILDRVAGLVKLALIPGDGDWRAMPRSRGTLWPYYLARPPRLLARALRGGAR